MYISKHFKYEELVYTNHSQFKQANYDAGKDFIKNMRIVANFGLEPLRGRFGMPIYASNCFRCWELHKFIYVKINKDRALKGFKQLKIPDSQHLEALAVDFIIKDIPCKKVFDYIQIKNGFKYGQLIWEKRNGKEWIHLGMPTLDRNMQVLIFENGGYRRIK